MADDTDQQFLEALFGLDDERAWKLGVAKVLIDTRADVKEAVGEVKKTNGRVTSLERWRDRILGAITVLMALPAIAGIIYALNEWGKGQ